jgi:hypothetical protein
MLSRTVRGLKFGALWGVLYGAVFAVMLWTIFTAMNVFDAESWLTFFPLFLLRCVLGGIVITALFGALLFQVPSKKARGPTPPPKEPTDSPR